MSTRGPQTPLSDILPLLILGTGTFTTQHNKDPYALGTDKLIHEALACGVRAFDTSPYYGPAEELLGAALDAEFVRANYPRKDCFLLTKVGRIAEAEFDYSAAWVRASVKRSLERLNTDYLDVVYCHDVEFVSQEEVLEAVKELRRIRDEEGTVKYIGISGYPLEILCQNAENVLRETGEGLDAVQSYAHFTVQNTTLATTAMARLKAAGVDVVPNGAPLGMGLLRRDGPPVGLTDFHPASNELRRAVRAASDFCDSHGEKLEVVSQRYALENWIIQGGTVGSYGDPASGVPWRRETNEEIGGTKLGVSVVGVSRLAELEKLMRIWRSILDGLENGAETASAAGRWRKAHELSVNRKKAVSLLSEGIQEALGEWLDYSWASPAPGFVNLRKPTRGASFFPTPEGTPEPDDRGLPSKNGKKLEIPLR